jgi:hypothetical protein
MPPERCSKCKMKGHNTRSCPKPWPKYDEQECDRCHGAHETGGDECSGYQNNMACDICGHEMDHHRQHCPIEDKIKVNIDQYTETKYWASQKYLKPSKSFSTNTLPSPKLPTSIQPDGISNTQMRTKMKAAKVVKVKPYLLASGEAADKAQMAAAAAANLDMAPRPSISATSDDSSVLESILANAVAIQLPPRGKRPSVKRYRIVLGSLWDATDEPEDDKKKRSPKREAIRAVLEDLFKRFSPQGDWVSDFFSHIVCIGVLYPEVSENPVVGECYSIDHYRPGRKGWHLVRSRIVFERYLDWENLEGYTSVTGSRPLSYLPDDDIRILNLITWKEINSSAFDGARSGKKFFSDNTAP